MAAPGFHLTVPNPHYNPKFPTLILTLAGHCLAASLLLTLTQPITKILHSKSSPNPDPTPNPEIGLVLIVLSMNDAISSIQP